MFKVVCKKATGRQAQRGATCEVGPFKSRKFAERAAIAKAYSALEWKDIAIYGEDSHGT